SWPGRRGRGSPLARLDKPRDEADTSAHGRTAGAHAMGRLASPLGTDPRRDGAGLHATEDDALVGIWVADDGFEITELLLRPGARYQLDKKGIEPSTTSFSERGRYARE